MTASVRISRKDAREIRSVLDDANYERLVAMLDAALKPKRSLVSARKRKAEKAETKREDWAQIREAVLLRANGSCEHCGMIGSVLEVDHAFGRGGGRKSLESVWTCWALASGCHDLKTRNHPSAGRWIEYFQEHCRRQLDMDPDASGYSHAIAIAEKRLEWLRAIGEFSKNRGIP